MVATATPPKNAPSPARLATLIAVPIALVAGVAAFWALGGFPDRPSTSAVPAEAPRLEPSPATVCRALVARLPEELGGLRRRPVTAGAEQNAAYGDPAIVLSCGVGRPAVPADAQLMGLSNVCWYPDERKGQTVWHTIDREVTVRVVVPQDADGAWLVNLSQAIVDTVPAADPGPVHC